MPESSSDSGPLSSGPSPASRAGKLSAASARRGEVMGLELPAVSVDTTGLCGGVLLLSVTRPVLKLNQSSIIERLRSLGRTTAGHYVSIATTAFGLWPPTPGGQTPVASLERTRASGTSRPDEVPHAKTIREHPAAGRSTSRSIVLRLEHLSAGANSRCSAQHPAITLRPCSCVRAGRRSGTWRPRAPASRAITADGRAKKM